MRFLVTGASGFVGGNLARMLSERGHEVTALVRRTSKRTELEKIKGIRFAFGDMNTGEGFDEAVKGVDVVHHLAGITKARTEAEYQRGNGEGTRLLAAALARQDQPARLIFCSSLAAAGPARPGAPRREDEGNAPVSVYGRSKFAGELAVRQYADRVPSVILRPPVVYGPGDATNLPPVLPMARFGVYFKSGLATKYLSFIHVQDLCEALIAAATRGKTVSADDPHRGVYFVSDPVEYRWEDFFGALSAALGKPPPRIVPIPELLGYAVGLGNELFGRLANTVPILNRDKAREMTFPAWTCSPARAKDEIGWTPAFTLQAGLENTVEWFKKEGMIR
jgi:dihydroflavonol-4-reductase